MSQRIWPEGSGVVHNEADPCSSAPTDVRTDLHTVPGDGKRLCSDCEWPDGAKAALKKR
ncbi:hypothetical protein RYH80_18545 [Halobaculum sp. MBLA0147]|uniref:hypothetical protein n=1 Tax=Halobaculum sp. MBLA0147 TaxID=3079934 RepID=UPI0035252109